MTNSKPKVRSGSPKTRRWRIGGRKESGQEKRSPQVNPAQIPLPILKNPESTSEKEPLMVHFNPSQEPKKANKKPNEPKQLKKGPFKGVEQRKRVAVSKPLPAQRGRVFSRQYGDFFAQGEVLADLPGQLPQFLPRTEWPEDPMAGAEHRPEEEYLDGEWARGDINVPPPQLAAREVVDQGYPQLRPMPPYMAKVSSRSGRQIYKDSIWQDHVGILHELRHSTLAAEDIDNAWLNGDEIMELLMCISYGMDASMAVLEPFVIAGPVEGESSKYFQRKYYQEFDKYLTLGYIDYSTLDDAKDWRPWQAKIREKILGRRYLVAPINQSGQHWTISIFDRKDGHLYIFDSMKKCRQERTVATNDLWARFWHKLDMPNHFQYYVAPVSEQPKGWECGLLCAFWVHRMLRERVGGKMIWDDTPDLTTVDREVVPNSKDNNYLLERSGLRVQDWKPHPSRQNRNHALQFIWRWACVVCANELGLKNDPELLRYDAAQKKNPIGRIMDLIKDLKLKDKKDDNKDDKGKGKDNDNDGSQQTKKNPIKNFFTGHGGMQFVFATTIEPLPYDKDVERDDHPTDSDLSGHIEFDPAVLAPEPSQDIRYIKFPLPPTPIANFKIKSFQQLPLAGNFTAQDYPLRMALADWAYPDRIVPDMMFNLSNVSIQQAIGGPPLLAFNASVHFDGLHAGQTVTASVALPIPQQDATSVPDPVHSRPLQISRTPLPESLNVHRAKRSRDEDEDDVDPSNKRARKSPSPSPSPDGDSPDVTG